MEISWTDLVEMKRYTWCHGGQECSNWIRHILRRNRLLKRITEGKNRSDDKKRKKK